MILIFTDDQGFGDLDFHGNAELKTPYLGRLASWGGVYPLLCAAALLARTGGLANWSLPAEDANRGGQFRPQRYPRIGNHSG